MSLLTKITHIMLMSEREELALPLRRKGNALLGPQIRNRAWCGCQATTRY